MNQNVNVYLQKMWIDYLQLNPQAEKIYQLLTQSGEIVVNDHIALRTFTHLSLGLDSLAQHFKKYGYHEVQEYHFKEKKLFARHYENSDSSLPKIFISELELDKVSPFVRETLTQCGHQVQQNQIENEDFVYSGRHWVSHYSTYLKLAEESEYASWVYAFGFRPNHFTVSINHLKNFTEIKKLNDFLKNNMFTLNSSGGEIKGTPEECLEQSSTMASKIQLQFSDGVYAIPGCYYEFAKRYSMTNGQTYQGFIAQSADKIFESTNRS